MYRTIDDSRYAVLEEEIKFYFDEDRKMISKATYRIRQSIPGQDGFNNWDEVGLEAVQDSMETIKDVKAMLSEVILPCRASTIAGRMAQAAAKKLGQGQQPAQAAPAQPAATTAPQGGVK